MFWHIAWPNTDKAFGSPLGVFHVQSTAITFLRPVDRAIEST